MRKLTLPFVALAALAAAVPAAGQDAKPLAGQTITVLMPSPQAPYIAGDFEAATGIHVNMQTLSWDDIRPKLVTSLIAGTAPADVTEFDWSWTGQFSAADWYLPLNDVIDADTVKDIGVSKIFTVNGNLLGVPYTNDFRVMLINKKHFADAGITTIPKTLDELVAAAKQIKEKKIATYPIGLPLSATEGASTS
jgi:multiple sugar transport system substrate-binding protein